MPFDDLHSYIQHLTKVNEVRTITQEVDPDLELTYILSEEQRIGSSKTLFFEKPKDSVIPAVGNLFSTKEKMNAILGEEPEKIGERLKSLVRMPDSSESMISRGLEMWREMSGVRPKVTGSLGGGYEELENVDLGRYPICRTWPMDAGRFITLPMVISKDPETGERNVGMYRMQVYDKETTGMHWHIHKGGSAHYLESGKKEMDVAVVIGADPLAMFSAVAPIPENIDEFSFAGLIARKRMELVRGKTVDIEYPKNAEIILEGYVDPQETRIEGPFGDHTGYYSLEDAFPVFHIRKIIERKDRIYPTTIVGKLWHEDVVIGKTIERMFLPMIQMLFPEIVDLNTMEEAVFHDMVVVSIKKRFPGHAKKVMFGMWGIGQLMFSKIVVVVDNDIDVHDRKQVIWAIGTRVDPERDVVIVPGTFTDTLDHASSLINYGSKMGIDATKKSKGEGYNRTWPDVLQMSEEVQKKVMDRWRKLGL